MHGTTEQVQPPFSGQEKSILDSKTFWGAVSTLVVAIFPIVTDMAKEFLRTGQISPITVFRISILLTTTSLTILGRVTAETPVYTPVGLPGPDKTQSGSEKSIFESKTFWGAITTAMLTILPAINDLLGEFQKTGKINLDSVFNICVLLATTSLTIVGRVMADTHLSQVKTNC